MAKIVLKNLCGNALVMGFNNFFFRMKQPCSRGGYWKIIYFVLPEHQRKVRVFQ